MSPRKTASPNCGAPPKIGVMPPTPAPPRRFRFRNRCPHCETGPIFSGFWMNEACPHCGYSVPELEPRLFSFNAPHGACQTCDGLGTLQVFDPQRVVAAPEDLSSAIGLNSAAWQGSSLIGPSLAGVTIAVLGLGSAFLLNAISFLAVVGAPVLRHVEPPELEPPAGRLSPR